MGIESYLSDLEDVVARLKKENEIREGHNAKYCGFCGNEYSKDSETMWVKGPTALICEDCIEICIDALDEWRREHEENGGGA